jgi:hypothetical protein
MVEMCDELSFSVAPERLDEGSPEERLLPEALIAFLFKRPSCP